MPQVEHYRDDLEFNSNGIDKLQRSTLCLADNFNTIFDQVFSNDKSLKTAVENILTNFVATVISALLGSTLVETITSVTKQSVFYTLLEKALEAAGVEWNFNNSNAWYICFGDLLGGLIIQGGRVTYDPETGDTGSEFLFPIAFNQSSMDIICSYANQQNYVVAASTINKTTFKVWAKNVSGSRTTATIHYVSFGY